MSHDRKRFSDQDRTILEGESQVTWLPPDPQELILPYIQTIDQVDRGSIEDRKRKAKEVMDGYGNLIEVCKRMEDEISEQCKNVVIGLDPKEHFRVREAIGRVFGIDPDDANGITFDMYKRIIHAFMKRGDRNIPKLGGE
jgi:hypothetical protein